MNCKNCGNPLREEDKFCPNCGQAVEITEDKTDATAEEVEKWYYVKGSETKGPYTKEEMVSFLEEYKIDSNTYVWIEGMDAWGHLKETKLNEYIPGKKNGSEPPEEKIWYYIADTRAQTGPFTTTEMLNFLKDRMIHYTTYVWKDGMADWRQLRETELYSLFKDSGAMTDFYRSDARFVDSSRLNRMVQERNIALAIVFSILTCGIYQLYWLYSLANEANCLSESQDQEVRTSAGIVLLLSIVTCGIYEIYFFYSVSKQLSDLYLQNGRYVEDNSVVNLLLALFGLGIVSMGIIQNTINEYVRYER